MPVLPLGSLLNQVQSGRRSSALLELKWLIGLLLLGLIGVLQVGAPVWLIVVLASCTGVVCVAFLVAYFYFMTKSPAMLRSEDFALSMYKMEKGYFGDSQAGVFELSRLTPSLAAPTATDPEVQDAEVVEEEKAPDTSKDEGEQAP